MRRTVLTHAGKRPSISGEARYGPRQATSWSHSGTLKVYLQRVMASRDIKALCLPKTHVAKSEYRVTDQGFLLIQSGGQDDERESAGVGFTVAPNVRRSVIGCCQVSRRIAYVKLRAKGGNAVTFSAYAPHNEGPFDERQTFYSELQDAYCSTSCHGLKVICGDLNARLHKRPTREEVHIGGFMYANPSAPLRPESNRDLLMESWVSLDLVIGNTLHEVPLREQVTFFAAGAAHDSELTPKNFATLDYILSPRVLQQYVGPVRRGVGQPPLSCSSDVGDDGGADFGKAASVEETRCCRPEAT